jgi:hypothetical protein
MGVPDGGAEGAEAPPPSLLGKQSQSGNIRFTVGQYWLIVKINVTNSVNFVGNMLSKGLIPRRAKCQKFRENTLVRKVSLVVISTAEKKFAKTHAFDWLRFSISNGVETNSTIPGEEKYFAEKHSKLIMRSNISHEIFRISLFVELFLIYCASLPNIVQ